MHLHLWKEDMLFMISRFMSRILIIFFVAKDMTNPCMQHSVEILRKKKSFPSLLCVRYSTSEYHT